MGRIGGDRGLFLGFQCKIEKHEKTLKTMSSPFFLPLSESQSRQFIDAETVHRATLLARKAADEVKGSMFWREVSGNTYLIRTAPDSSQRSLGAKSDATQEIFDKFVKKKETASNRLSSLEAELVTQQRMCKALRVGRVPNIVTKILNKLEANQLSDQFLVIGTHAIYAYESAAGVRVQEGAMATMDVDLLFDTRKMLAFSAAIGQTNDSFINLMKKVDPTFELLDLEKCTLQNDKGFQVQIVRRLALDVDPHPLRMTGAEDDVWPVQIPSGESLLSARRFDQMVVSTAGDVALMRTVHPLDFARVKERMGESHTRDSIKRNKDLLQAKIVTQLVHELLPHLAVSASVEKATPFITQGEFFGRILDVADGMAVQRINRTDTVRHDVSRRSAAVKEGDVVDIKYKDGVGVVGGLGIDGKDRGR